MEDRVGLLGVESHEGGDHRQVHAHRHIVGPLRVQRKDRHRRRHASGRTAGGTRRQYGRQGGHQHVHRR